MNQAQYSGETQVVYSFFFSFLRFNLFLAKSPKWWKLKHSKFKGNSINVFFSPSCFFPPRFCIYILESKREGAVIMPPYPKCSVSSTLLQHNATSVWLLDACHVPRAHRASHCEAEVGSSAYTSLTAIDGLLFSCYAGGRTDHLCRISLMYLAVETGYT